MYFEILDVLKKSFPQILKHIILVSLYIIVGYLLVLISKKLIYRITKGIIDKKKEPSRDFEARIKTLAYILDRIVETIFFVIIMLTILGQLGVAIGPLLTGLGIVGVAVGFGAQYLIKDLIAGFFMILEDQIRVGDFVKIDSIEGIVEAINLRTTKIRGLNGQLLIIPNGSINIIANFSRDFLRAVVDVDLPYSVLPEKAFEVLKEAVSEVLQDESIREKIISEPQILGITSFQESSLKYRIIMELKLDYGSRIKIESKIRNSVLKTCKKYDISIPYPQREIRIISQKEQ